MIPIILMLSLQSEIRVINLLNGLELDSSQKVVISDLAQTANDLRDEFEIEKQGLESELEPLLSELKEILLRGREISSRLKKSIHKTNEKIMHLKVEYERKLDSLAKKVKLTLTPEQYYVLEEYKPCLIPLPGEVRIGQSENPVGIYNLMNRLRRIPNRRYQQVKEDIAKKMVEKIEIHKPIWVKIDHDQLKREMINTLDEVRSLSDVDFAVKRDEFVDRLKGFVPQPQLDMNKKIIRLLLAPEVAELVKTEPQR